MNIGNNFYWFHGVVEDVKDPKQLGRVRVRVVGIHTGDKSTEGIPTADLPWATVLMPNTGGSVGGIGQTPALQQGSWIVGFFRDGYPSCQDPIILGSYSGLNEPVTEDGKLRIPDVGFYDPDDINPRDEYLDESDINKLARGIVEGTIVEKKKEDLIDCVPTALEGAWSEPETPYDPQYPHNKVTETSSGHVVEYDDTPGAERIHEYHKSGTFREIHPDGQKVEKIVSDNVQITKGSDYIFVGGDADMSVGKNTRLKVGENFDIEIAGNVRTYVAGKVTMQTDGDFVHKVGGKYQVFSDGNMTLVAPRIDLNPEGISSSVINPGFRVNKVCPVSKRNEVKVTGTPEVDETQQEVSIEDAVAVSLATSIPAAALTAISNLASGPVGPEGPQGPAGSGCAYTVGPTQPSTASEGCKWFNTVLGLELTYLTGAGWVALNAAGNEQVSHDIGSGSAGAGGAGVGLTAAPVAILTAKQYEAETALGFSLSDGTEAFSLQSATYFPTSKNVVNTQKIVIPSKNVAFGDQSGDLSPFINQKRAAGTKILLSNTENSSEYMIYEIDAGGSAYSYPSQVTGDAWEFPVTTITGSLTGAFGATGMTLAYEFIAPDQPVLQGGTGISFGAAGVTFGVDNTVVRTFGNQTINGDLYVVGGISADGGMTMDGDLNLGGNIYLPEDGVIQIGGDTEKILFDGDNNIIKINAARVQVPQYIQHLDDSNTNIQFTTGNIAMHAASEETSFRLTGNQKVELGDLNGAGNSYKIVIDDENQNIKMSNLPGDLLELTENHIIATQEIVASSGISSNAGMTMNGDLVVNGHITGSSHIHAMGASFDGIVSVQQKIQRMGQEDTFIALGRDPDQTFGTKSNQSLLLQAAQSRIMMRGHHGPEIQFKSNDSGSGIIELQATHAHLYIRGLTATRLNVTGSSLFSGSSHYGETAHFGDVSLTAPVRTEISKPVLKDYQEFRYNVGTQSGIVLDPIDGNVQTMTGSDSGLAGTYAIQIKNGAAQLGRKDRSTSMTLICQDCGKMIYGSDFWHPSIQWPGGSAPSLSVTGTDVVTFTTINDGSSWLGFVGGLNFS